MHGWGCLVLCLLCATAASTFVVKAAAQTELPNVTYAGYLPTNKNDGSELFYAYYEAQQNDNRAAPAPVLLWLQGGPGCASMFGNLYELGPAWVNEKSLQLVPNPGAWNRRFGLLFIDQPVGSGFSIAGSLGIPSDETQIATDLYAGLQNFYALYEGLQSRPLFITGESYAGKYVPALGHYILQLGHMHKPDPAQPQLLETQEVPAQMLQLGAPLFKLAGLAIGNGLTDPKLQVLTHADTCYYMSIIDQHEQLHAMKLQLQVAAMISAGEWKEASRQRELLLAYLQQQSGVGTLLDTRRTRDYDADSLVDKYLNLREVQEALNVKPNTTFVGCSDKVAAVLGPDVMKSVKPLIPDLLAALPVLLYQGQFDAQDGPGSVEAWTTNLDWPGKSDFFRAKRHIWRWGQDSSKFLQNPDADWDSGTGGRLDSDLSDSQLASNMQLQLSKNIAATTDSDDKVQPVVGFWKHHKSLTTVVLKDAGHMVPRDQPMVTQNMVESWVQHCVDHWWNSSPTRSSI